MLTFKDWLYTHKFSDLELEILKNIELDSIDSFINELGVVDFNKRRTNGLLIGTLEHFFLNKNDFYGTYEWGLIMNVWIDQLNIRLDFTIIVDNLSYKEKTTYKLTIYPFNLKLEPIEFTGFSFDFIRKAFNIWVNSPVNKND